MIQLLKDVEFKADGSIVASYAEEKQRLKYTLLSSVLLILCPAVIQIVFNRLTAILN